MILEKHTGLPQQAFDTVHPEWQPLLNNALKTIPQSYLHQLASDKLWLPGTKNIFNAFSLPLSDTHYLLLGESPYPRPQSANGYAFWDAAVDSLWSENGLSKTVNRATSLRNFIKMLLVAANHLGSDTSQVAISRLNKQTWVGTGEQLFNKMLSKGFLLLNASLVLSQRPVKQEAKIWHPFLSNILAQLAEVKPEIKLLLFGKIAENILPICPGQLTCLVAEHPYNISFIHNPDVIKFFAPLDLLAK